MFQEGVFGRPGCSFGLEPESPGNSADGTVNYPAYGLANIQKAIEAMAQSKTREFSQLHGGSFQLVI